MVLVLIGAGCLTVGLRSDSDRLAGPVAPQLGQQLPAGGAAPAPSGAVDAPKDPVVTRSTPVALRIPAIGLAEPVSTLGLNPDGTVQVPTDPEEVGWFRLGPSPGQVGSAVMLGHVDSYEGPAVFFRLGSLRPGDRVHVTLADDVVAHFVVRNVAMYLKERFPARQVYASHGYSGLQLVTCGGTFDTDADSYESNVVVYTSLVSTSPATAPAALAGADDHS